MSNFDCVIIGSGIAGMTAAIYLKRYNIDFVLLEKNAPGGLINRTSKIENYPGVPNVDGVSLSMSVFEQVMDLGVTYKYGNVLEVKEVDDYKIIKTDMEEIKCKSIIIATGRKPRELEIENEKFLIGRGISWCATCDGIFYKDKNVGIVGGGNTALEEAVYLSNICKEVNLIHRRNDFRADEILKEKVINTPNIKIWLNSNIEKLNIENEKLVGVKLDNEERTNLDIEGIFLCIGYDPDTKYMNSTQLKMEDGYIIVDQNMRTNLKNIYACGDVIKKNVYQLTTAVGEATIAATSLKDDLMNK